jgi:uncharacterized repeat protein (TIGR03803 family)
MRKIAEVQISRIRLRRATTALASLAAFGLGVVATPSAKAQSLSVLYSFTGAPDGAIPFAGLIRDKAGNLYGTTTQGGASNVGSVFKLDTSGNETVLHSFTGGDGWEPFAALIRDKAGNLYGTTQMGGASGGGTVFKLDTSGNETVLHSFSGGDGAEPYAGLIMDKAGNLYGTTELGGTGTCFNVSCGIVFKLDTSGNETVLHSFANSPDGGIPYAGLVMDKAGNLYGTTLEYGASSNCFQGCGTVFKLDTSGNETVLHSFTGYPSDGAGPRAGLIMDKAGNLYGTTSFGGGSGSCGGGGCGTVFKLDTSGNETVLHSFTNSDGDGANPNAGLIMDKAGNLYGTTFSGGDLTCSFGEGCGTVFKLDTSGNETVLHSFTGGDGAFPVGGLIRDKAGHLYGTTTGGGTATCSFSEGCGTVFKLTPPLDVRVAPLVLTFFPPQAPHITSAPQKVMLWNQGIGVTITSIGTTGDFAQGNDCPAALDFDTSCTLDVTFIPTSYGPRKGGLIITYNSDSGQKGTVGVILWGSGLYSLPWSKAAR